MRGNGRRHYFTRAEVEATCRWARAQGRTIFNGCTLGWLRERFGAPVYHKSGVGWFWYPKAKVQP